MKIWCYFLIFLTKFALIRCIWICKSEVGYISNRVHFVLFHLWKNWVFVRRISFEKLILCNRKFQFGWQPETGCVLFTRPFDIKYVSLCFLWIAYSPPDEVNKWITLRIIANFAHFICHGLFDSSENRKTIRLDLKSLNFHLQRSNIMSVHRNVLALQTSVYQSIFCGKRKCG